MWGSKPATCYSQGTHNSVSQGSWMPWGNKKNSNMKLLNGASDWKVSVDLKISLEFPVHIIQTEKWPDIEQGITCAFMLYDETYIYIYIYIWNTVKLKINRRYIILFYYIHMYIKNVYFVATWKLNYILFKSYKKCIKSIKIF